MKYLLLMAFSLIIYALPAQTYKIEYVYNASGGRTLRKVVELDDQLPQSRALIADEYDDEEYISVDEGFGINEAKVYPNPTEGYLTIDLTGTIFEISETNETEIILYDATGRLLQTRQVKSGLLELDLSSYPQGWYLLILEGGNERQEYKIVKK